MREQIENAKRYAVRLKSGNEILGSGVLWKPEGCQQNKLYIFTAAHVVKGKKNINVEFEVNGNVFNGAYTPFLCSLCKYKGFR